jgi:large subunit ribosomal protein L10
MAAAVSTREGKQALIGEVKGKFDKSTSAVFVDYKGMTVESATKLRASFRKAGVEYKVVKNTLIKRALEGKPYLASLDPALKGMTGVAWSFEEPSAAAKVVKDFAKANEKLGIKAGLLEGQVLDAKAVENQLAQLPGKDEARAALLAQLMAPAQQLVMLLNTPAGSLVRVLQAKADKA